MELSRRARARGRCAPTTRWAACLVGASVGLALPVWALDPSQTIRGKVDLGSDLTGRPGAGVELDAKYRLLETFTLPLDTTGLRLELRAAPD